MPEHPWWDEMGPSAVGKPCDDDFVYASDTNDEWLSIDELRVGRSRRMAEAHVAS